MSKTSKPSPVKSVKRINLDKTNTSILVITAASSFVVIFCLVGAFSLLGQLTYQNRVITEKKKAVTQLKANIKARDALVESFTDFANAPSNFLGGSSTGAGPKDGNNAKLVLDALPSKYDFPALVSSLDKISKDQGVELKSVTGNDDEVAQAIAKSGDPTPIQIPFHIITASDYAGAVRVVDSLDHSIRPIQVQSVTLTGAEGKLNVDVSAVTYYQTPKQLTLKSKVVK